MLLPKALGGASGGGGFWWQLVALMVLLSPPLSSPGFSLHCLLLSCLLEGRSPLNLGPIWVIQHDLISRSLITSADYFQIKSHFQVPRIWMWTYILRAIHWMVFPVVMYGCDSWTIKKVECWVDAFKLWCWRWLLRVPWKARRSNQSILKEINPKYSLEGLMLKLKLQYLATWYEERTHWKRP